MTVLAIIGALALLWAAFYLGVRVGARYMAEVTTLAAKQAGYDPIRFGEALEIAKRDYERGKRV